MHVCSVGFISRDVVPRKRELDDNRLNRARGYAPCAGHMARARQTALHPSTDSAYGDALSKKADTAMYEDEDDDRFEAALRLAEDDPARGANALRSIVADDAFDPDTRFEAAARLAEVDEAQAAEALRSIVADDAFDPDTRSEAAARLAEVGG